MTKTASDFDQRRLDAPELRAFLETNWRKLRRETGGLKPGKMNGHRKRALSGPVAGWLRERIEAGPFTTRQLAAELVARGIKTDRRAVWVFLHAEGLSFKKNGPSGRAGPA